jgi:hypothetical protein
MAGLTHITWVPRGTKEDRWYKTEDCSYEIELNGSKWSVIERHADCITEIASGLTKLSSAKKIVWLICHG